MWRIILLGLPVGLAFGYIAQRGRFCPHLLDWESFFVLGIPLGAFLAARRAGEFRLRYPGRRRWDTDGYWRDPDGRM